MSFKDFQKAPNRLTSREIGFLLLAGIIVALVLYGLAVGNYRLANFLQGGGEFYLLRTSGQSFLFDQIEPYSGIVPARVQDQVYGGPAVAGEKLYILDIPFHLLILIFPLAVIPDVLIARAFWLALTEVALAGFIYIGFRIIDKRLPVFFYILIAIAGFFSFYTYRAMVEGSLSILLGLMYVGILLSLRTGLDELSGALMVLSAFQWEMGGPFLLLITFWIFWEKRRRVFFGAGMLAFILLAFSFFLYPGWLLPFLRAAWSSFKVGYGYSLHDILGQIWPQFGSTLSWVITAILVFALGYEWYETRRANLNRLTWTAAFTLAATPFLGFHVELEQLVPLILPLMLIIIISRERWQKLGNGIALLQLAIYFGVPWLLFTQGLPQRIGIGVNDLIFLLWPSLAILGMYWIRWWTIRPPRTWLDRATEPIR